MTNASGPDLSPEGIAARKKLRKKKSNRVAGIVIVLGIGIAIVAGVAGGKKTFLPNIGDTVTLKSSATAKAMPAGDTRSDYDKIVTALAANDNIGLANLTEQGLAVPVGECATGKLLDTAIGGERQIRIESDPVYPKNVGQAVWVDTNWVKASC